MIDNLLSSGMLLIVFGAALAYFRTIPLHLWHIIERNFIYSLTVYDEDESYYWLKLWLSVKLQNSRSVSVFTRKQETPPEYMDSDEKYRYQSKDDIDKRPKPTLVPAPGLYFFWFENKFCWVYHERREAENSMQRPRESFVIKTFSRDRSIGDRMLAEARDVALPLDGKVEVRMASDYNWKLICRIPPRPLESVILDNDICGHVHSEVKRFINSKNWYSSTGIPYRLGVLLYGPPGGGKTSLVLGVASALHMHVNILSLSSPGINDNKLIDLLSQCDNNTITLIEDVDCSFEQRNHGRDRRGKMDGLTFSGLLNALDGLAAQGRIIFMTTNFPEKLDEALIRPGRVDLKIHIDNARPWQARVLFSRFFPKAPRNLSEEFASKIPDKKLSMASLQGHLMRYREDPANAIVNIKNLIG